MARILLAEDDSSLRGFLTRALERAGHQVIDCENGDDAIDALEHGPYDLLLTDIVMPIMDGVALALKAGKSWPDMCILMMTGYANERDRAHNLDLLIHDIVVKPFTVDEIILKVDDALQG